MNRPSKLLDIHDVQLKTLKVEVAALTVSGKQMTLSTFRQLPERDIWRYDPLTGSPFALRGIPWGRVLYFWGDQGRANGQFHLVWQDEELLYRMYVMPKCTREWLSDVMNIRRPDAEYYETQSLTEALEKTDRDVANYTRQVQSARENAAQARDMNATDKEWYDDRLVHYETQWRKHLDSLEWQRAVMAAWEQQCDRRQQLRLFARDRYVETIDRLLALPQLFIAI
jgi:hypothetical protein